MLHDNVQRLLLIGLARSLRKGERSHRMCGGPHLRSAFERILGNTFMLEFSPTVVVWGACLIQLFGLLVLAAARCGRACPECKWLQGAFFFSMTLLGGAAMVAFQVGSGCWASCGATLAVMAVGAVLDLPAADQAGSLG